MSLRARLRLSIVALVAIVVIALAALFIYDFARLAFEAAAERADLVVNQVKSYVLDRIEQQMSTREGTPLVLEELKRAWAEIVRTDPYIRKMLERTAASAGEIVSIHISGENGTTLAASSPYLVGGPAPVNDNFSQIKSRNAFV